MDATAAVHVLDAQVHAVNSTGTQLAYVALAWHEQSSPSMTSVAPWSAAVRPGRDSAAIEATDVANTEASHDRTTINH